MKQAMQEYFQSTDLVTKYAVANSELHGLVEMVKLSATILSEAYDVDPDVQVVVAQLFTSINRAEEAMRKYALTEDYKAIREISNRGDLQHGHSTQA